MSVLGAFHLSKKAISFVADRSKRTLKKYKIKRLELTKNKQTSSDYALIVGADLPLS